MNTAILQTLKEVRDALDKTIVYMEIPDNKRLTQPYTETCRAKHKPTSILDQIEKTGPFAWYHFDTQGKLQVVQKKPSWPETVWPPLYTFPPDAQEEIGLLRKRLTILQAAYDSLHGELVSANKQLADTVRAWGRAEREGWQPIETAPKDGTKILLARIGRNEVGKDLGIWWAARGFWSSQWNNWNDGIEPSGLAYPTHWIPLPAAPKQEEIK